MLQKLKVTSVQEAGLTSLRGQQRRLLEGFLLGFISLALAVGIILLFHGRMLNATEPAVKYVKYLSRAAISAVVVSVLEEILFRGGIHGALRRVFHWRFALVLSSAIYAILHFFQSANCAGPITWYSGLEMLPHMAAGFVDTQRIFPGFLNLTLAGAVLALAYQRTDNLWFSIGLHGGWVFWLKTYGFLTDVLPDANVRFWGTSRLTDGWMICLALMIASLAATHFILLQKYTPKPWER